MREKICTGVMPCTLFGLSNHPIWDEGGLASFSHKSRHQKRKTMLFVSVQNKTKVKSSVCANTLLVSRVRLWA